ncbi:RagB/SusD family nutrient uptake outer membrane protein [termite gut metagenome]|uniref:RagB/SusD family nutrient uptake outer membrane protein n=1 Tax=termite gut metagenome TaxID=433724 RepID=A0A5J4RZS9_9ZZZZ
MKPVFKIFVFLAIVSGLSFSCKDFLDVSNYFDNELKIDSVFADKRYVEAYLWGAVAQFPDHGKIFSNPYTPGPYATDEAFTLAGLGEYRGMAHAIGEINASNIDGTSFCTWNNLYKIIRKCNTLFARIDEADNWTTSERNLILGYARFFRAFAYYSILMDFGPPVLLGDELVNGNEMLEYYDRPRCLYDEAVEYVCSELEQSALFLPAKQQIMNFGRPTKGAAYGLIARLRLIHASPLYNGGTVSHTYFGNWTRKTDGKHYIQQNYDEGRWALAAAAAKRIMDMLDAGLPQYALYTVNKDSKTPDLPSNVTYDPHYYDDFPNGAGGIDPYRSFSEGFNGEAVAAINPEFVWGRPSGEIGEWTRRSFPIQVEGWSECCVPQKIIDNFRMVDGRTIYEASPEYPYSETGFTTERNQFSGYTLLDGVYNMYANREPRFYASIGFSECLWPMSSTATSGKYNLRVTYYYDSPNGRSGAHNSGIYTVTGYVAKKTIHPVDAWSGDNNRRMNKAFGIIRYAEILLSYAEALNNLTRSHTVQIGDHSVTVFRDPEEIKKGFNPVRYRCGLPGLTQEELDTPKKLQAAIEQERMIEFFHENRRYYDVRRWGIYEQEENKPIMGMNADAMKDNFYQRVVVNSLRIGARVVDKKMIFVPIPKDEVRRMPAFDQNPGWEN